jgi:hypothetical protein
MSETKQGNAGERALATTLAKGRRWTPASAQLVLEDLKRSGESIRAYATRMRIDPQRLELWHRRLGAELDARSTSGGTFLPVRVSSAIGESSARERNADFEVVLAGGRSIRVGEDFDAPSLRRLIEVLEEGAR